jgi:molybdate transport system regulatory protein
VKSSGMRKNGAGRDDAQRPCVMNVRGTRYSLKGRVWVEGIGGAFLGHGRAVLLERIKQYGSITEAARSLNMSYRHAWDLVESMNGQSDRPLVETVTGGKGGGGARLTGEGEKAIRSFREFQENFRIFLEEQAKKLRF